MISNVIDEAGRVILGKEHQVRLAVICLLAKGNLLIEDLPGMGKTTLSQVLAKIFGLSYRRIQFTSDLLPADILGVSVYNKSIGDFSFRPGPVFSQLVLADEVNRASPKTQSALLEAMEEGQVTADGVTRPLPEPFFVIATQNPSHQMGTYTLPESQLDRFLMRIELGYPPYEAEKSILLGKKSAASIDQLDSVISASELLDLQRKVSQIFLSEAIVDYILRLVHFTRQYEGFHYGLSPRGSGAIARCAQAWALSDGRSFVLPEDVQAVLPAVVDHRVIFLGSNHNNDKPRASQLIIEKVAIDRAL